MHRCPVLCSQNQRQAKLVCYGVARVAVKYGTKDDDIYRTLPRRNMQLLNQIAYSPKQRLVSIIGIKLRI